MLHKRNLWLLVEKRRWQRNIYNKFGNAIPDFPPLRPIPERYECFAECTLSSSWYKKVYNILSMLKVIHFPQIPIVKLSQKYKATLFARWTGSWLVIAGIVDTYMSLVIVTFLSDILIEKAEIYIYLFYISEKSITVNQHRKGQLWYAI